MWDNSYLLMCTNLIANDVKNMENRQKYCKKHQVCTKRVFSAQADRTLTHRSHKNTEHSTIETSITFDGVTLTDSLIRRSPNELPSFCPEITTLSADKMFWTSNKPAKWTPYINIYNCTGAPLFTRQLSSKQVAGSEIENCDVISPLALLLRKHTQWSVRASPTLLEFTASIVY
jgi:hypothetical protein